MTIALDKVQDMANFQISIAQDRPPLQGLSRSC